MNKPLNIYLSNGYLVKYNGFYEELLEIEELQWIVKEANKTLKMYKDKKYDNSIIKEQSSKMYSDFLSEIASNRDQVIPKKAKYKNLKSDCKTYLMKDLSTGYTKIGRSKNPKLREKTLQSEKPTIELFGVCENDIERSLHDKFKGKRIRGEWFNLSKSDIEGVLSDHIFNLTINKIK